MPFPSQHVFVISDAPTSLPVWDNKYIVSSKLTTSSGMFFIFNHYPSHYKHSGKKEEETTYAINHFQLLIKYIKVFSEISIIILSMILFVYQRILNGTTKIHLLCLI